MSESPVISVIIVNYNGRHLLDDCLGSLSEQTFRDFEVILVDNGSTDGSVKYIQDQYPEVKVVSSDKNLGYGGGNNRGIEIAQGRYFVFLNNDTRTDPHWLQALFEAAETGGRTGMCASRIMDYEQPDIIDNTGLLMYRDGIARGRGRLEKYTGQYAVRDDVFFPSGCAGLYRREMLEEIGYFDEDLFLYLDDVDIGLRGRLAGWDCIYVPGAVVYHKYSATAQPYSPLKAFLVERNRLWIVFKYFPLTMIMSSFCYAFARYLVQAYGVASGKGAGRRFVEKQSFFTAISVILKAYFAAFSGLPKLLRKRRAVMAMKKAANREIREWFKRFGIGVMEVALKD